MAFPSTAIARSVFAMMSTPDVSLSSRWTRPGRSAGPAQSFERWRSAFTSVPSRWPTAGWTTRPGRLVEDEDFGVFEEDRERNVLRRRGRAAEAGAAGRLTSISSPVFTFSEVFFGLLPPIETRALCDPLLDLRARGLGQVVQVPEEDAVEALAGVAPVGAESPAAAGARRSRAAAARAPSCDAGPRSRAAATTRHSAMNCDVDIAPKTAPRGSPRKNSIVNAQDRVARRGSARTSPRSTRRRSKTRRRTQRTSVPTAS